MGPRGPLSSLCTFAFPVVGGTSCSGLAPDSGITRGELRGPHWMPRIVPRPAACRQPPLRNIPPIPPSLVFPLSFSASCYCQLVPCIPKAETRVPLRNQQLYKRIHLAVESGTQRRASLSATQSKSSSNAVPGSGPGHGSRREARHPGTAAIWDRVLQCGDTREPQPGSCLQQGRNGPLLPLPAPRLCRCARGKRNPALFTAR